MLQTRPSVFTIELHYAEPAINQQCCQLWSNLWTLRMFMMLCYQPSDSIYFTLGGYNRLRCRYNRFARMDSGLARRSTGGCVTTSSDGTHINCWLSRQASHSTEGAGSRYLNVSSDGSARSRRSTQVGGHACRAMTMSCHHSVFGSCAALLLIDDHCLTLQVYIPM